MGKPQLNHNSTSDVDDAPPPAYQETPPFNPNYQNYQSPPFNPNYNSHHHHSPPHTPDINPQQSGPSGSLYPQLPQLSPHQQQSPIMYSPQQQQQQQQSRYQTIEIPYSATANTDRIRRRQIAERRKFPIAAVFFLFGWFCPPLWIIGACCCAGNRNEYESFWGKVNFIMAMALIVTSLIYSAFAMSQYDLF